MSILKVEAALAAQLATVPNIIPDATIVSSSVGNPSVFTTAAPHGFTTGMNVIVTGHTGSVPVIGGVIYFIVVTGASAFTLQNSATKSNIGVTIAGSGGLLQFNVTAHQNVAYQTVQGIPYQLVEMISSQPDEPTQGGGYYKERGLYQVTLIYPLGVGVGALKTRAELIRNYFKKGSSLTYGGITVIIDKVPSLGIMMPDSDTYSLPVKISYSADIYN